MVKRHGSKKYRVSAFTEKKINATNVIYRILSKNEFGWKIQIWLVFSKKMKFPQNPNDFAQNGQKLMTSSMCLYWSKKVSNRRYVAEKILTKSQRLKEFEFDNLNICYTAVMKKAPLESQNIIFWSCLFGFSTFFTHLKAPLLYCLLQGLQEFQKAPWINTVCPRCVS